MMYSQLYNYLKNTLFSSQCDFKKDYSAQHCPLVMIKNFKEAIDRGDKFSALLTDLSKAFDCINHSLLIAKIDSYEVSHLSTKIVFLYLTNRTQLLELKANSARDLIYYIVCHRDQF